MNILIVEDSEPMRRLIKSLVGDLAEHVFECSDGAEAIAAYAGRQLDGRDWALMDIKTKGMDGITATRELTSHWPEARVVIGANFDEPSLRAAARELSLFVGIAVVHLAPRGKVGRVAVFGFSQLLDHGVGELVDDGVDHHAQRLFLILVQVAQPLAAAFKLCKSHLADLLAERADSHRGSAWPRRSPVGALAISFRCRHHLADVS